MMISLILDEGSRHICLEEIGPIEFSKVEKIDLFTYIAGKAVCHRDDMDAKVYESLNKKKAILEIGDRRYFIGYKRDEILDFQKKEGIK